MRRANSLVAMLVTILIVAVLVVVFMKGGNLFGAPGSGSTRKDGKGTTVPGAALARSEDAVCMEHLRDLRMAITVAQTSDGDDKFPETLEETKQGPDFYKCPLGGEPYQYDPKTGVVHCVHPGHEKY
jgi:hypothetical protein